MTKQEVYDFVDVYSSYLRSSQLPKCKVSCYRDSLGDIQFCLSVSLDKHYNFLFASALLDMRDYIEDHLICITNCPVTNCLNIY